MKKKIWILLLLWGGLTAAAWFGPQAATSEAERRHLAQRPKLEMQTLLSGKYMSDFEDYSLDQFPMRDPFREVKALIHYYVLRQKDNNGIYLAQGFAAQQLYPMKEQLVDRAIERLQYLHDKCLADSKVVMAIVPDKGYYLAKDSGQPSLDYETFFSRFREALPWAEQVDLTDSLSASDYYRTDTHWRQEKLIPAAQVLCRALGVSEPEKGNYRQTALSRPFYGVYYGQAALPMEPERLYLMESDLLSQCSVYDYESGRILPIYDRSREEGKDLYEVYLSGPRSLLTVTNPNGKADRELLIFRDSFASSIAPLLLEDYSKVTLIDIRYIQIDVLERFVDFHGQDALLLLSTLVLNNGY